MIDRDERGRLSHAVTLQDRESESLPKIFCFRIERRTAGNKGPELPTETTMHFAKRPPATEKTLVFLFERRTAGNKGPELPTETTMHFAKRPPATEKTLVFRIERRTAGNKGPELP